MKKLFVTMMIVVASLSATTVMAGNVVTETYPIKSNYTAISAKNMIEVVLLDAPKNSVRVEIDELLLPHLQITVKSGVLHFSYANRREVERLRKRNRDIKEAHIYVSAYGVDTFVASGMAEFESDMPLNINVLTINASGMAKFDLERVECKTFNVSISGMAEVDTEVNAEECKFEISGMSDVDIEGRTNHLTLGLSGMSEVSFEELIARTAKVNVSGMSSAEICANESITGGVSGMSKLTSYGQAGKINVSTSGGSSHKHIKR
jgi:hypothetical protein